MTLPDYLRPNSHSLATRSWMLLILLACLMAGCGIDAMHMRLDSFPKISIPESAPEAEGITLYADSVADGRSIDDPQLIGLVPTGVFKKKETPIYHDGPITPVIDTIMRGACAAAGFTVADDPDSSDLILRTTLERLWRWGGGDDYARAGLAYRVEDSAHDSAICWGVSYDTVDWISDDRKALNESLVGAIGGIFRGENLRQALRDYRARRQAEDRPLDSVPYYNIPLSSWADRPRSCNEPDLWGNGRLFLFRFELLTGGGKYSDLTETEDSTAAVWGLGRTAQSLECRFGAFTGPVGLQATYFLYVKPWAMYGFFPGGLDEMPDENGNYDDAFSHQLECVVSFGIELFSSHIRLEPQAGYGWRNEWTTTEHYDKDDEGEYIWNKAVNLRDDHRHLRGGVFGGEVALRSSRGTQLRTLYRYGDYAVNERRLDMELRFTDSKPSSGLIALKNGDADTVGFVLGYRIAWRDDGRSGRMFYLGFGTMLPAL